MARGVYDHPHPTPPPPNPPTPPPHPHPPTPHPPTPTPTPRPTPHPHPTPQSTKTRNPFSQYHAGKNNEKYLQVRRTSYIRTLWLFQMFAAHLFEIKLHLLSTVFSYSVDFKAPGEPWNPLSKAVPDLVNFPGLVGIVNAAVYKTEPIFTGLGHGKLS